MYLFFCPTVYYKLYMVIMWISITEYEIKISVVVIYTNHKNDCFTEQKLEQIFELFFVKRELIMLKGD
jgi:hypothetical protein